MVRMEQYISWPLSFRNPPAIFCLFFYMRVPGLAALSK